MTFIEALQEVSRRRGRDPAEVMKRYKALSILMPMGKNIENTVLSPGTEENLIQVFLKVYAVYDKHPEQTKAALIEYVETQNKLN